MAIRKVRIPVRKVPNLSSVRQALAKISSRSRVLPRLTADQFEEMHKPDTRAGKGKGPAAGKFMVSEKLQLLRPKISAKTQPNWVRVMAEKKVSNQAAIKTTLERVDRFPTKPNLTVAQHVLNDIGAKKGGSALLRKMLTQETVTRIIKKGV